MRKGVLIAAVAVGLGALVFLGVRDIHRFDSQSSSTYSPASSPSSSNDANAATPASTGSGPDNDSGKGLPTIKFVKNPTPVPDFTIKDLEGHPLSSADLRGKVVLLNFWATWCPPCREEIPDLIKLQNEYQGKLQIVGLSDDTGPVGDVKSFVKDHKMNYPIAIATPELEAKFGGVMGLPTSFLVDTQGRVVQKHVGLRNPVLYDTEIRALLNLPVDAKVETFTDTGQVFLTNAKNATELPGVDFSKLNAEQKKAALRQLNEQKCTCGCNMTIAQCRVNDTSCETSEKMAKQVVAKVRGGGA